MPGPYAPSSGKNYVGLAKQATKGTGLAPTFWVPYNESVDLAHGQALNRTKEAGESGMVSHTEKISHLPSGRVSFLARPAVTTRLVAMLLGTDTLTGVGPFTHTLSYSLPIDYATVEQNLDDDLIERFVDAYIGEVTLSCSVENPELRAQASWVGGNPEIVSATAESYETDDPFVIHDAAFTVDGTVRTNVRSFELTIRGLHVREQVNDVILTHIVKLGLEAELSLVQFGEDIDDEYRRTHYGSPTGTNETKTPSTGAFIAAFNYGAGAGARQARVEITNLDYDDAVYTALQGDASEAVKITRGSVARKEAGSGLLDYIGITNDNVAYT